MNNRESIADFLARGGKIVRVRSIDHDLSQDIGVKWVMEKGLLPQPSVTNLLQLDPTDRMVSRVGAPFFRRDSRGGQKT